MGRSGRHGPVAHFSQSFSGNFSLRYHRSSELFPGGDRGLFAAGGDGNSVTINGNNNVLVQARDSDDNPVTINCDDYLGFTADGGGQTLVLPATASN